MRSYISFLSVLLVAVSGVYILGVNSDENLSAHLITNCDGTQFIRTTPGELRVQVVARNLPGCIGPVSTGSSASVASGASIALLSDVTNCSGLRVISYSDGTYKSFYGEKNTLGCKQAEYTPVEDAPLEDLSPRIDLSHGPLLDLASTDITNYRAQLLKEKGIRFANAIRSARIRRAATKASNTEAILMKNDAVVVDGKETGWVKVQGANLEVTDSQENIVEANTDNKATGYTTSRLLRDPNASDLVAIEQADHAYWSDIAYTNVDKYVNVRSNPNYLAPIVTTLANNYPLYVISTVDNWSLVRNDSGSIRGYVRSDYLRIEKVQRVDTSKGVQ